MELTKTDITSVISTGIAEQSPLADDYIRSVKERHGFDIIGCYIDTSQILCFPAKKRFREKELYLANSLNLTVYMRGKHWISNAEREKYKGILLDSFLSVVSARGEDFEYNRTFSPDEIQYYGWTNKKYAEWDLSKVIRPTTPIVFRKNILVESFDSLAGWHYMRGGLESINALPIANDLSVKVYCGWDPKSGKENLYIIPPESKKIGASEKESLNKAILAYLHSVDKNSVIDDTDFSPIYTHWSELSDEMRFHLLKD